MRRFEGRTNPLLLVGIGVCMLAVLWTDVNTPLGVAEWVMYLVPVALSLFAWSARVPVVVAGVCSLFVIAGYYLSPLPPNYVALVAVANRTLSMVSIWVVALVARQSVLAKLAAAENDWIREGVRALSARMLGEQKLPALGAGVLEHLCRYLDAPVAALWALEDDGVLRRVATYAPPPGAPPAQPVAPGDGLVGRTLADNRILVLHELPPGALPLRSGLVDTAPRHLVLAPLHAEAVVNGVVELGFVRPVQRSDLDLLGAVSTAVGMAIRSSLFRARLEELLARTQHQAEELQTQQEELRVANEELEQQTQHLRESQARLEEQQQELEATNAQLAEQAAALEAQRDELERARADLVERADQLARANQYKSEFLANMSHELRTPLNSSLILAKLLADNREGNLTGEQVKYAQTIHAAGNDLLALINDILDLSRIESGRLELHVEETPVARLVEELQRVFQPVAAQKGLVFETRLEPGAPESLTTDAQRLQQVVKNLLSNAFKFTQRGEVRLRVSASGPDRVAFAVSDTGIGIPPDKLDIIFEAFRQADGSTHRQYGGTGLGLSISRDLARRLGGDVHVVSTPGQGSTFTLVLPVRARDEDLQAPPRAPRPAAAPPALFERSAATAAPSAPVGPAVAAPRPPPPPAVEDDRERLAPGERALAIIEDDVRFAGVLRDLAREQGYRALVATTAADGLDLVRRHRPAAVLLDVNLPDQSGLSVLEQLKHSGDTRHIPVHVVSVADYSQQALEMGAVGYALKPVPRDELLRAFDRLRQKFERARARVLVVEDAEVQRESLRALLQGPQVEIVTVGTAAEALQQLREATFDCMVLDLGLPDMTGYELLERMSGDESFSFPPVIVYTGRALTADEELRLRRYSHSVVIKGARSPERLLDEVTLFLHRVESQLPERQQRLLREARNREAVFEGRRILLAEDDVRNIFALTSVLEPRGARLVIARNGREALQALERASQGAEPAPDLVLMDVMMPEMDGLTALRELRRRPEWRRLPVIALTAKAMPDDRDRCLDAGANDYIAKPLDVEKLLSLVRVWMPK